MSYFTFGYDHRHVINGVVFDKDCIAECPGGREQAFALFGPKFAFEYDTAREAGLHYYSRGVILVTAGDKGED